MEIKVYTKRHGKPDPIKDGATLLKTIRHLRGEALVPRGVYRFQSFEEANEWMIKQMARTHVRQKKKIL